jgi:hypothetical protein
MNETLRSRNHARSLSSLSPFFSVVSIVSSSPLESPLDETYSLLFTFDGLTLDAFADVEVVFFLLQAHRCEHAARAHIRDIAARLATTAGFFVLG